MNHPWKCLESTQYGAYALVLSGEMNKRQISLELEDWKPQEDTWAGCQEIGPVGFGAARRECRLGQSTRQSDLEAAKMFARCCLRCVRAGSCVGHSPALRSSATTWSGNLRLTAFQKRTSCQKIACPHPLRMIIFWIPSLHMLPS